MEITRATRAQARECVRRYTTLWGALHDPAAVVWWVLDGSPGAGFAGARLTPDGTTCRMTAAWVAPEHRGHGIQLRMLRIRLRFGRSRGCEKAYTYTWIENTASQRSIVRAGFLPVRCVRKNGDSWIVYERAL